MPTLSDLIKKHTDLATEDLEWIHSLVSDWQLLADLSFADLVLWVPAVEAPTRRAGWRWRRSARRPGRRPIPRTSSG